MVLHDRTADRQPQTKPSRLGGKKGIKYSKHVFVLDPRPRIRQSQGVMLWINRVLGGMFVYLGFRVAMLETR